MSAERDVGVYLEDIWESIERIEQYTKGLSQKKLIQSVDKQDAIVHRLEIIGEAAKHIPKEFQNKYPKTPWKEIARTRDKITHYYFEIDLAIIWGIIQNDLKPLKEQVKIMLEDLDSK